MDEIKVVYYKYSSNDELFVISKQEIEKLNVIKIPLKNIGKCEIEKMCISVYHKESFKIVETKRYTNSIDLENEASRVYYYDKILPSETVNLCLYYDPKTVIFDDLLCDLDLYYKDSYNNYYEQPLSLFERSINEPTNINKKIYAKEVDNYSME